jgi:2-polyprenyl-3-methyl-5-hydroxy-6-metoxy-1,4-benzoquinol methylase
MASRSAARAGTISGTIEDMVEKAAVKCVCPACAEPERDAAIERYGRFELFHCAACGLQFWEPREMPDAGWYEQMYGGRDQEILPLEPGHKYFLTDTLAPRGGELLDIGCGTGNFLAAACKAGYRVTGIELDRNAAQFAKQRLGLERVLPLTIAEFAGQHADEKFDVVTFFEVLEHQTEPAEFLRSVRACLKQQGTIALSVPNRERWLTGPDVLDYPPNHFLRWNAEALKKFLTANEFEVLSVQEQPAGMRHTAQMINMALRTGMTQNAGEGAPASFREVMQMTPEQAKAALQAKSTARQRLMQLLGRIKYAACFPLALAAFLYVRLRGYKATYLYCLARRRD